MTRLNLVPPGELTDQHLFAEFREIKMVSKSLCRSIVALANRGLADELVLARILASVPAQFTLNAGHVTFFYDKGRYLERRYKALKQELSLRSLGHNTLAPLDPDGIFNVLPAQFRKDYAPTPQSLAIVRQRIHQRIMLQPHWYRYRGKPYASTT